MTLLHRKAIELKYKGYTYREISQALGGKISENTLKMYFAEDGMLFLDYIEYEAEQNKWGIENAQKEFKRLGSSVPRRMQSLYKLALKKGNYDLCFKIMADMADRAGMVVVKKTESKDTSEPKGFTHEQFVAECKRRGVDPDSGFRLPVRDDAAHVQPQAAN